jgi:hypothetical protein
MIDKLKEIVDIVISKELRRKGTYIGYESHFVKLVSNCVKSVYGETSVINSHFNMIKASLTVDFYDSNLIRLNEIEVKFTYNKTENINKFVIEYISITKLN